MEQIKASIREFGFRDPIAVWRGNEIIEGHGRLLAAMEMDEITDVPVIRLDDLTDEQRRAYMLVHNKLTMNTDFDLDLLNMELNDITAFDMGEFGFDSFADDLLAEEAESENPYSQETKVPQYEPTGKDVELFDLYDTSKTDALIEEIKGAGIEKEIEDFLIEAARRHTVFNYKNIAEYYANTTPQIQRLMEHSALVIIDINDAIANGFVKLSKEIEDIVSDEEQDE